METHLSQPSRPAPAVPCLAVLADIHGHLPALDAVLNDAITFAPDAILVAGDLVAGGPFPAETLARLRAADCLVIRGNAEDYIAPANGGAPPSRTRQQWAVARWAYDHLDARDRVYLAGLPAQALIRLPGTAPIRMVHGSPRSPNEGLVPDANPVLMRLFQHQGLLHAGNGKRPLRDTLAEIEEDVLICAHTHVPWTQEEAGRLALNPGALGGSLHRDPFAWYALLTWDGRRWRVEHRAVPYDLSALRAAFLERGLLSAGGPLARAFLLGSETGENVGWRFVRHAADLARAAGHTDADAIPDALWEEAERTFDWEAAAAGPTPVPA